MNACIHNMQLSTPNAAAKYMCACVVASPPRQDPGALELRILALKCLQQLLTSFGKMAEPHAPAAVSSAWHLFTSYLVTYKATESEGDAELAAQVEANVQQVPLACFKLMKVVACEL